MLIVPGTGLLTDAYGLGGWGPYSLFKWSLAAKLRGCRVLFVSVLEQAHCTACSGDCSASSDFHSQTIDRIGTLRA